MNARERIAWAKVCELIPDEAVKPVLDWADVRESELLWCVQRLVSVFEPNSHWTKAEAKRSIDHLRSIAKRTLKERSE